jgi:hypothetical protein
MTLIFVDKTSWGTTWAQRPLLFHNIKGTKFELVPAVEGTALAEVMPSRGMAFGDIFNEEIFSTMAGWMPW